MPRILRTLLLLVIGAGFAGGCGPSQTRFQSPRRPPAVVLNAPQPVVIPAPPIAQNGNPWKPSVPLRDWKHIVIHHTASASGSVPAIHEAHLQKGWDGIGYHFVIGNGSGMPDGGIEATFRWKTQMHGAHAKTDDNEFNERGIGICLIGNFDETKPTAAQMTSVKRLVATLKREYRIPAVQIVGHRDVKPTACPGRNFPMTEVAQAELLPFYVHADDAPAASPLVSVPVPDGNVDWHVSSAEGNLLP